MCFPLLCCMFPEVMELEGTETVCTLCYLTEGQQMPGPRCGAKLIHRTSLITRCCKQLLFSEAGFFTFLHRNICHFLYGVLLAAQNLVTDLEPLSPNIKINQEEGGNNRPSSIVKSSHDLLSIVVCYLNRQHFFAFGKKKKEDAAFLLN